VTKQPVLLLFWYLGLPLVKLQNGLKSFNLLGEKMVLWLDAEGNPIAVHDRLRLGRHPRRQTHFRIDGALLH
jgi:hypothetical protein